MEREARRSPPPLSHHMILLCVVCVYSSMIVNYLLVGWVLLLLLLGSADAGGAWWYFFHIYSTVCVLVISLCVLPSRVQRGVCSTPLLACCTKQQRVYCTLLTAVCAVLYSTVL